MPVRPAYLVLLTATLAIAACGTKGPLTLPPPQQKAPLTAAKTQSLSTPVDTNTTKESVR